MCGFKVGFEYAFYIYVVGVKMGNFGFVVEDNTGVPIKDFYGAGGFRHQRGLLLLQLG